MSRRKTKQKREAVTTSNPKSFAAFWLNDSDICVPGYTPLDHNPEIMTACRRIASLLGSATIHLMNNTEDGDVRIINELSRAIDIEPMPNMTRATWMEAIVMNLLLYGHGNSIVVPHTWKGLLQSLEPISASRVSFMPVPGSYRDYNVMIDGRERDPLSVLHFVYNPDPLYMWKGRGVNVSLRDIADALKQGMRTEKAFLSSEYKPSIIVKVDALTEEFASPDGREKLLESYAKPSRPGDPWLIPAEQFDVTQVKPLTLEDLAISDTMSLNKKAVAAIFGVPPYLLGVGDYHRDEWNSFIETIIMPLAKAISQELTKKLILNPSWYLTFNVWSLKDYDLQSMSTVLLSGADRGFVNGDEWRQRLHMSPVGLKEYKVLENYIPYDMSGNQLKLTSGG